MSEAFGLLKGKVALITGTGRGIRKCMAERFAQEGATVYANAIKPGSIDQWAKECSEQYNTGVIPQYYDVTDSAAAKSAVLQIIKEQSKLDILVNNAAVLSNQLIGMILRETIQKLFEVNVFSVIEMIQLVSKLMVKLVGGSIINISSIVGVRGNKGQLTYSATKGAVIALTRSAAKELASKNIRVNSIAPGLTDTDAMRAVEVHHLEERIANIGMGRLGKPLDIANACVFLASDLSEYISGEVIGVNGCTVM